MTRYIIVAEDGMYYVEDTQVPGWHTAHATRQHAKDARAEYIAADRAADDLRKLQDRLIAKLTKRGYGEHDSIGRDHNNCPLTIADLRASIYPQLRQRFHDALTAQTY